MEEFQESAKLYEEQKEMYNTAMQQHQERVAAQEATTTDEFVNGLQSMARAFAGNLVQKVQIAENKLQEVTEEAEQHKCAAERLQTRLTEMSKQLEEHKEAATRLEEEQTALREEMAQQLDAHQAARRQATELLDTTQENNEREKRALRTQHEAEITQLQEGHKKLRQQLTDKIAEVREQCHTKDLQLEDFRKELAERTRAQQDAVEASDSQVQVLTQQLEASEAEKAQLQKELDDVYARIADLMGGRKEGTVARGMRAAVSTAGAVCVAAKEELTEAVKRTHNYAPKTPPTTDDAPADVTEAKTGGGDGGGGGGGLDARASPFVAAMDRSSATTTATTSPPVVTRVTVKPRKVYDDKVEEAFSTVKAMGFDIPIAQLDRLLKEHNNNMAAVVDSLCPKE